ncbi:hypothetical protein OQH61_05005 [Helicobacter sp. MIT 21-1697]|uniref:hypothetical protein n=1 Tax=Helicobacter sp. MIT 21-1697 TaxID=2993733 RepID=UPI00224AD6E4|nr:hypothetical protein [Helicobacter sp. MIT 21-1697]MCX2717091.1 hypothetical protein [Helicobacter sp. MIT 21-1697]
MAVSPIGNVTYINQNSQLGSIQYANNMQKVDFALHANMQEFVDKLKAVQEVSPTPQTEAINPDDKQEKKRNFKEKQDEQEQDSRNILESGEEETLACTTEQTHLLDIKA